MMFRVGREQLRGIYVAKYMRQNGQFFRALFIEFRDGELVHLRNSPRYPTLEAAKDWCAMYALELDAEGARAVAMAG